MISMHGLLIVFYVIMFSFSPLMSEECTFNGFNDGPLHQQQGWWLDKKDSSG